MAKKKYTKEEIKQKRNEQRQKAALKSYRCRGLKNFLFYLTGFLTSIVILVTALFVGLKVVPIKTYLGDGANGVVSEKVSSKSIIDALLSASTYDMNDFPVVVDAVDEILNGIGVDGYIEIDKEKVKSLDFNGNFTDGLLSCIKIAEGGAQKILGEFGNLDVFQNKWDIIPTESDDQPQTDIDGNIEKTDKGELLSNPKLYYFQKPVDGGTSPMSKTYSGSYEWARAFDDDGHPINGYTGTQPLYYANLNVVPIVDILDLIDESLGRVSLDSIIDIALKGSGSGDGTGSSGGAEGGAGSEGGNGGDAGKDTVSDLISKLFKGKTIKDITNSEVDTLFNDVLIIDLDLEEDVLEIIKAIAVDKDGNSIALENITIGNLTEMDLLEYLSTNYADVLAKLEIGQKPLTELLQMSYESSKTIYDLLYAMIDWDKAGIENEDIPQAEDLTLAHVLKGNIKLDSLQSGYADILAKMDIGQKPLSELLEMPYEGNEIIYDLLFDLIDWTGVEPEDVPEAENLTLVHVLNGNISLEKFSDFSFVLDSIGISISKFLGEYNAENENKYKLLHSIINWEGVDEVPEPKDLTISHLINNGISLDNIDLDSVGISISKFLGEYNNTNKSKYELLHSIINWEGVKPEDIPEPKDLTVGDLANGINFNKLPLSKFLGEYESHQDVYKTLSSIIIWPQGMTPPTADKLTVGDLSYGIDFDKFDYSGISLSRILGEYDEDTKDMYNILHSIINWEGVKPEDIPEPKELTIGDLSNGIKFDNLSLSKFLGEYEDNKFTYDVLCSAVGLGSGEQNYSQLTVSHLKGGLNIEAVSLTTLGLDDATVDLLLKAANASRKPGDPALTKDQLAISHIKADMFKYLALTDVMPFKAGEDGNVQLYSILLQASGISITNPADQNEINQKAQTLNISSLANFKIAKVSLSTILPTSENAKLYNLLADAMGKDASLIKISDFANFDPANLHLSTVITESDNVILQKMIESGATIGNLGDAIDSLSLYDIYGENCFVPHDGSAKTPRYKFIENENTYVLDSQGTYMISKTSGIWLLLCFDADGIEVMDANVKGCGKKYTISDATLSTLTNGMSITSRITNATIRQLVDAGILESANPILYTKSLQDAVILGG